MINLDTASNAISTYKGILTELISSFKPFIWTTMSLLCFIFLVISIVKTLSTTAAINLSNSEAERKSLKQKIVSIWVFFAIGCILVLLAPTIMEVVSALWTNDLKTT
ncbi:hypothetical protein [[Mycoplasma] anseris]|uniref:hypothetical protein n=1 Tax=[Mycoplasma] anseris TaxID=92400 RepID=UPI0011AB8217|nr:hypothetical protein [[Mycoplasma] anseris]